MCGISLIFNVDGAPASREAILRMNGSLLHRGPDEQDVFVNAHVALGHTRLSIVDVDNGHQPLASPDGRYVLTYNGELYNYRELRTELEGTGYRFRTQSDTEVLLALYMRDGADCLQRLRGMFAFAVHDTQSRSLFLARDRLGIKPLYYHWNGKTLVAASEIKALFASGFVNARLNLESIRNHFFYQFSVPPFTSFTDVFELQPGQQMFIRYGGEPEIRAYWDLEFPRDGDYESMDENYWLARFEEAFAESVTSHMIGDVPIAAYLSGGIDSSAITWQLRDRYPDVLRTFSIHQTNPNTDESEAYTAVARHLGVENKELTLHDDRPDYLDVLAKCVYHLEQPQRLAVDVPHFLLSGLVNDSGYKVVYNGDGADEILGGYDCFRQDYMRYWGNQLKSYRLRRRHYLTEYTQWFPEEQVRLLLHLHRPKRQRQTVNKFGCYPAWFDFWHIILDMLPSLFSPEFDAIEPRQMDVLAAHMKPKLEGRHMLNQSLYIETKTRLPGWILWKSDRLSMANSVEARVPFMDHPLVELAARMPPAMKLNGMDEKYVLRKVACPHLPENPTQYKKRAFYSPIREWFFTPDRAGSLEEFLSPEALRATGLFNPERVSAIRNRLENAPQPRNGNDYYGLMKLEWVLMLVLTTQMLSSRFVEAAG